MDKGKQLREAAIGYNLVIKFGVMLMLPIFCSLFSGIFLDKKLGTTPWLTLILMLGGMVFSIYAVYKVASRMTKPDQNEEDKQDG